jgi:hypothetical protein
MTPSEIQQLAETISAKGIDFPWYVYLLGVVFPAITVYFAGYLSTKAALRANNENFEFINEQLKKTTRDTEEIKVALSGSSWLSQQQWALREKYYGELLTQLHKLYLTLLDRSEFYIQPGSEHDMSIPENPRFVELDKRGNRALEAIRELMGPASIYLSDTTISALEKLVSDHWSVAFDSHPEEYVSKTLELVTKAKADVLAQAKKQLAHWTDAPSVGRPASQR